jgi:hypothetical protein
MNETEFRQRIRDYGFNTLGQVAALTMSALFATAALALADILRTPDERWLRLTLWASGVLNSSSALMRLLHAGLTHVTPSPYHLPLVLAWGFIGTINFALIPLATGGADGWRYVYFLIAALFVIAWALARIETNAAPAERFAPMLRPFIERRNAEVRLSIWLILFGAGVSVLVGVLAWVAKFQAADWSAAFVIYNAVGVPILILANAREIASVRRLLSSAETPRDESVNVDTPTA